MMGYFRLPTIKADMFKLDPDSAVVPAVFCSVLGTLAAVLLGSTHLFLIEQYVCRGYYSSLLEPVVAGVDGLIDESLCKLPEIQSEVAGITAINSLLMFMPALFLTGPWGKLAKILGKRPVIFLNACSLLAQACFFTAVAYYHDHFNIRWIWATPLFDIIGGGPVILSSQVYTYIAESVDATEFSGILYRFSALQLIMAFLSMSFSSYILRINVWILCLSAIAAAAIILPATFLFPTKPYTIISRADTHSRNSSLSTVVPAPPISPPPSDEASECSSLLSPDPKTPRTTLSTILSILTSHYTHTIALFREILDSSPLTRLTLLAFFLLTLTSGIRAIFTQWASTTYSWTIAEVHTVSSFEMLITALILFLLTPVSRRWLVPLHSSTSYTDLFLSRISLAFGFLGLLLMAISPTRVTYILAITTYTLGSSFKDSLRSFSTGLIGGKEEIERCYLGIGLVETLGGMAASAMWVGVFSRVVGIGWWVSRLPFWGCLVVIVAMAFVVGRLGRFVRTGGTV